MDFLLNFLPWSLSHKMIESFNFRSVIRLLNFQNEIRMQGMDKMIKDDKENVTITNDGATILQRMKVLHPAARMLVELSKDQLSEVKLLEKGYYDLVSSESLIFLCEPEIKRF